MGSCCRSKLNDDSYIDESYNRRIKLPSIIIIPQDSALIYLDMLLSPSSIRLRNSLKEKFPNLIIRESEKRIFNDMEMINKRKYYIIIIGNLHHETLRLMIKNYKIKGIYFYWNQSNLNNYFNSTKIKGVFHKQIELKKAIYYDVRFDKFYLTNV
ncbi:unnamed protein product [Adineta steineri]|uniref:Uncharacterized protein n=1 Tax=Adineta steineri TaxID=433720 RepID=A0A814LS92_9BILA|nr:unnamed protein product [Adineta steineri]CAF3945908.1 unnamed protein product [Adineta steineri]